MSRSVAASEWFIPLHFSQQPHHIGVRLRLRKSPQGVQVFDQLVLIVRPDRINQDGSSLNRQRVENGGPPLLACRSELPHQKAQPLVSTKNRRISVHLDIVHERANPLQESLEFPP